MASIGQKLKANDAVGEANVLAGLKITPARLRHWGVKSALSLVDQGFTSGAGFLVNLLLARWMPAPVYGAFAVAFAGFLFVAGFHNVLILEPMSVMGPSRHAKNLQEYFRAQLKIHALLVGALSVALLIASLAVWIASPGSPLIGAMAGSAIALPLMLLLWLVRRMCYVVQRPSIAVAGSALYLGAVGAGLFVLARTGWLGAFSAFALMGGASAVAAIVLWTGIERDQDQRSDVKPILPWRTILQENWRYGRWLTGSTVLYSIANQVQVVVVAAMLGLTGAGVLRAMQLPSLVMTQIVTAIIIMMLPSFASEHGANRLIRLRTKVILTSSVLGVIACVYAAALFVGARPAESLLFAGRYDGFERLMSLLAIAPVFLGFNVGATLAIRALQRPEFDLYVSLVAAPVGLFSATLLTAKWGVWGAAASFSLAAIATMLGNFICLRSIWPTSQQRAFGDA